MICQNSMGGNPVLVTFRLSFMIRRERKEPALFRDEQFFKIPESKSRLKTFFFFLTLPSPKGRFF